MLNRPLGFCYEFSKEKMLGLLLPRDRIIYLKNEYQKYGNKALRLLEEIPYECKYDDTELFLGSFIQIPIIKNIMDYLRRDSKKQLNAENDSELNADDEKSEYQRLLVKYNQLATKIEEIYLKTNFRDQQKIETISKNDFDDSFEDALSDISLERVKKLVQKGESVNSFIKADSLIDYLSNIKSKTQNESSNKKEAETTSEKIDEIMTYLKDQGGISYSKQKENVNAAIGCNPEKSIDVVAPVNVEILQKYKNTNSILLFDTKCHKYLGKIIYEIMRDGNNEMLEYLLDNTNVINSDITEGIRLLLQDGNKEAARKLIKESSFCGYKSAKSPLSPPCNQMENCILDIVDYSVQCDAYDIAKEAMKIAMPNIYRPVNPKTMKFLAEHIKHYSLSDYSAFLMHTSKEIKELSNEFPTISYELEKHSNKLKFFELLENGKETKKSADNDDGLSHLIYLGNADLVKRYWLRGMKRPNSEDAKKASRYGFSGVSPKSIALFMIVHPECSNMILESIPISKEDEVLERYESLKKEFERSMEMNLSLEDVIKDGSPEVLHAYFTDERIKILMSNGMEIIEKDGTPRTRFINLAPLDGMNEEIAKFLAARGFKPNKDLVIRLVAKNRKAAEVLMEETDSYKLLKDGKVLEAFIRAGALETVKKSNDFHSGFALILAAVQSDNEEMLGLFIKDKSDVTRSRIIYYGLKRDLISEAISNKKWKSARFLLKKDIDVTYNAMEVAVTENVDSDILCGLISKFVNITNEQRINLIQKSISANNIEAFIKFFDPSKDFQDVVIEEKPLFHYTVECGSKELVQMLIEKGADINEVSGNGITSLEIALARQKLSIANLLIRNGFIISKSKVNDYLLYACANGYTSIAKLCLQSGAYINTLSPANETPLILSVQNSHNELMKLLLLYNPNIEIAKNDGMTALLIACERGNIEAAKILLEKGTSIRVSSNIGGNALHYAVISGNEKLLKLILEERSSEINESEIENLAKAILWGGKKVLMPLLASKIQKSGCISAMISTLINYRVIPEVHYTLMSVAANFEDTWIFDFESYHLPPCCDKVESLYLLTSQLMPTTVSGRRRHVRAILNLMDSIPGKEFVRNVNQVTNGKIKYDSIQDFLVKSFMPVEVLQKVVTKSPKLEPLLGVALSSDNIGAVKLLLESGLELADMSKTKLAIAYACDNNCIMLADELFAHPKEAGIVEKNYKKIFLDIALSQNGKGKTIDYILEKIPDSAFSTMAIGKVFLPLMQKGSYQTVLRIVKWAIKEDEEQLIKMIKSGIENEISRRQNDRFVDMVRGSILAGLRFDGIKIKFSQNCPIDVSLALMMHDAGARIVLTSRSYKRSSSILLSFRSFNNSLNVILNKK